MRNWYAFAKGRTDGNQSQRDLLGGKGANLAEMCNLGISVPPGFTLPTPLCLQYYDDGSALSESVLHSIDEGLRHIEKSLNGPKFGDSKNPLLVSVRSGAKVSMPGMMDTVLNIGLTHTTLEGLAERSGNRRFALDSYRRLIQMYGDVVAGLERHDLEAPLVKLKEDNNLEFDHQLTEAHLESIIESSLEVFESLAGFAFPQDPLEQVRRAVAAVFGSWRTKRAITYRELNDIPEEWGTAANIQAMVFGNLGPTSGTGVAFSRDPSTGGHRVLGEWLPNAQGEDVVAGIRTPGPLHGDDETADNDVKSLENEQPTVYAELIETLGRLERHYTDIQDVEFTVQDEQLFILQTRNAKRTAAAALKVAVDLVDEDLITESTALNRVDPEQISQLLHPQLDPDADKVVLAQGLNASPGAATGLPVIDPDEAAEKAKDGLNVILVRKETSPEDIQGMHAAKGILTATGGMTSHAAVVARGMGRPCVAGCRDLVVDEQEAKVGFRVAQTDDVLWLEEGEELTIDGATGEVFRGRIPTIQAELGGNFARFLGWADKTRTLKVRANADTPEDAETAVRLGGEGIGLCRTEHMFFAPDRINVMRQMILSDDEESRRAALKLLQPMQQEDFEGIFRAMGARPVTIRLLDPPLHEFLPQSNEDIEALAKAMDTQPDTIRRRADELHEFNPMLGHRGCRLGITYPEIMEMQTTAIVDAACIVAEEGLDVKPEIMVPLVMEPEELSRIREQIRGWAHRVFERRSVWVDVTIGTMLELPRACLTAGSVAQHADFFSFGTNDLTQTTMGLSRDDSGKFLPHYVKSGILAKDPFQSIDQNGVGQLVKLGSDAGRAAKKKLKLGICGEHGGDPASVGFFHRVGLDYVSCSPFRIPVARLAAAQALLNES